MGFRYFSDNLVDGIETEHTIAFKLGLAKPLVGGCLVGKLLIQRGVVKDI